MNRNLKFERYLRHTPGQVWRALTDHKALARWYLDNDFRPVVGHQFTFRPAPETGLEGVLTGEVILVDEPYQLVYTFHGDSMKRETIVTWTLIPDGGGTLLLLQHTGFSGLHDDAINVMMKLCPSRFLGQLTEKLDRTLQAII